MAAGHRGFFGNVAPPRPPPFCPWEPAAPPKGLLWLWGTAVLGTAVLPSPPPLQLRPPARPTGLRDTAVFWIAQLGPSAELQYPCLPCLRLTHLPCELLALLSLGQTQWARGTLDCPGTRTHNSGSDT